ncbi:HlyD family type I secretion periplasmic adaptor subunit [Rhodoferax sp.]|uniref:HlyD family type I secretion periplasmic adaptor subunit n=1 Tax=Rhodoferax sp. TaxID=50421 RepID=UPI002ACD48C4|nr:HlyD family type I secretion periplasmic adaptor subunit [Rhodoferax sp.]MDZ7920674.1 HlyD family type I secretion periplasmic adaptor subunit [Rhodoferax sp.]
MNTSAMPQAIPQATPIAEEVKPRHPTLELISRYKAIFRAAWAHRKELAGPARLADEVAFLPAALSLQDTPVHPAPRRLAYLLMGLFILALVWSLIGEVDIVATAPGRIIVSERTKVIQPLEASVVKAVLVKDGDKVHAGQVLVELDPTMASADKASVQEQYKAALSEEQRTKALLQLLSKEKLLAQVISGLEGDLTVKDSRKSVHPEHVEGQAIRAQLISEWQDISAKLSKLDAESNRRQAEIATVKASIAKLEATVPMAQSREADFTRLVDQGFISSHATQDKTRERVELERDLATQRARLSEAMATAAETEQTKAAYKAETQRQLNDRYAQASTKRIQLSADSSKATQREKQTQLVSPVDGTVQQLAIHTTGGVVTSAQQLMVVVPDATQVTAEVAIANQDIGFVNASQAAEIKLETFSFTKYGTVKATVDNVSADAVTDEKRGSFYPAILTLNKKDMLVDGKQIPISPGMNITAEIKTGKRRIIEFLLSPVQRMSGESLRER